MLCCRRAARQLDALLKELCVPLGKYVKEFPPVTRLHPFERALLELTVGPGTYERVLGRVDGLRKSTVQVSWIGGCTEESERGWEGWAGWTACASRQCLWVVEGLRKETPGNLWLAGIPGMVLHGIILRLFVSKPVASRRG